MISVGGFIIIIMYFIGFIFYFSLNRLKQFKWIAFNAAIIISIFCPLGTAIFGCSFIEFSMLLYDFTAIATMIVCRERFVDRKATVSAIALLIIIMLSLANLILSDNMPEVVLVDTSIDAVFFGKGRIVKAVFTSSNLSNLKVFLLMIIGLVLSMEYFKSSSYIDEMLNIVKKAFYVFFVISTIEFIVNNSGYVEELRTVILKMLGNYEESKVYIAQNRFGYYGITTLFPEQSYVSLMIIFLGISYVKGLHSNKDILWYIYGIAVIFMFGCTTSIMLVPFAIFIYIKEAIFSKSKISNKVTLFKYVILIVCISISVFIVSQNLLLVSEALSGTLSKLSAYIVGGGIYSTSAENSASIRNFGNHIALQAFFASPLLGVGIGTTRGYGILSGLLANFGLCGVISYLIFLNSVFKFSIKKKTLLVVILLLYFSTILSVWYSYYFTLIPIFALFSKKLYDRNNVVKEIEL